MTKPSCTYSLDQVRDSGLFSSARMEAIATEIDSRISTVHDSAGRVICASRIARFADGSAFVYPKMDHEDDWCYLKRQLLADILTPEELKMVNDHCHAGWNAAAEAKRFEKAEKLDSWDGWVTDGDHYWDSVETYLDERGDELDDLIADGTMADMTHLPAYLWVATPQQVIPDHLDVADVTEHYVCDRGWEDCGVDDLNGVKELQAALDAFVKANETVVSYTMDQSRVVLLAGYLAAKKRMDEADEECNRTGIHPIHQR